MKLLVLVTLISVAFALPPKNPMKPCPEEVSAKCPELQGEMPVYLAHPDDCSKFCECSASAIAFEIKCDANLFWDDVSNICNWPYLVS